MVGRLSVRSLGALDGGVNSIWGKDLGRAKVAPPWAKMGFVRAVDTRCAAEVRGHICVRAGSAFETALSGYIVVPAQLTTTSGSAHERFHWD